MANEKNPPRDVYAHTRLVNEILLAIGARKDCRVWKNATGSARSHDGRRVIKFGLEGSADILGITSDGKFLAIECKTGAARQNKQQIAFEKMITFFGGRYIIARESDDVIKELAKLDLPTNDYFSGQI